jgi:hypothetical protein
MTCGVAKPSRSPLSVPVHVAVALPDRLAGLLVEADNVLTVVAVETRYRLSPWRTGDEPARVLPRRQVVPFPDRLCRLRVKTGSAGAAEVEVDALSSIAGVGEA